MVKHIKKTDIVNGIIIFVEGDTEKIFYEKFIKYCDKSKNKNIIIKNVKGIGNYQLKMPMSLQLAACRRV